HHGGGVGRGVGDLAQRVGEARLQALPEALFHLQREAVIARLRGALEADDAVEIRERSHVGEAGNGEASAALYVVGYRYGRADVEVARALQVSPGHEQVARADGHVRPQRVLHACARLVHLW